MIAVLGKRKHKSGTLQISWLILTLQIYSHTLTLRNWCKNLNSIYANSRFTRVRPKYKTLELLRYKLYVTNVSYSLTLDYPPTNKDKNVSRNALRGEKREIQKERGREMLWKLGYSFMDTNYGILLGIRL